MAKYDSRKQSLYFPAEMHDEIRREADRIDRPLSWIMQRCWIVARGAIRAIPDVGPDAHDEKSADTKGD